MGAKNGRGNGFLLLYLFSGGGVGFRLWQTSEYFVWFGRRRMGEEFGLDEEEEEERMEKNLRRFCLVSTKKKKKKNGPRLNNLGE